jgi:hypothetical protein
MEGHSNGSAGLILVRVGSSICCGDYCIIEIITIEISIYKRGEDIDKRRERNRKWKGYRKIASGWRPSSTTLTLSMSCTSPWPFQDPQLDNLENRDEYSEDLPHHDGSVNPLDV